MAAVVKIKDVWRMLDDCAKGHTRDANKEFWTIKFNGKTYPGFPTGKHGRRDNPEIQSGHVRSLVRHFLLPNDCVQKYLNLN